MIQRFHRLFQVGALAGALALGGLAQEGSNYDPPPVYEQPEPEPPPPPPPPEQPFWQRIDYTEPINLVKIALFFGSLLMVIRCYRDLQE